MLFVHRCYVLVYFVYFKQLKHLMSYLFSGPYRLQSKHKTSEIDTDELGVHFLLRMGDFSEKTHILQDQQCTLLVTNATFTFIIFYSIIRLSD